MKYPILAILLTIVSLSAQISSPPVSGRSLSKRALLPADVLARAELLYQEIEEIRKVMGKATSKACSFYISEASPRHVFHQAQILRDKIEILAREFSIPIPLARIKSNKLVIKPPEVFLMFNDSLKIIYALKKNPAFTLSKNISRS